MKTANNSIRTSAAFEAQKDSLQEYEEADCLLIMWRLFVDHPGSSTYRRGLGVDFDLSTFQDLREGLARLEERGKREAYILRERAIHLRTLRSIAEEFGLSKERIRSVEGKALRLLRFSVRGSSHAYVSGELE